MSNVEFYSCCTFVKGKEWEKVVINYVTIGNWLSWP